MDFSCYISVPLNKNLNVGNTINMSLIIKLL